MRALRYDNVIPVIARNGSAFAKSENSETKVTRGAGQ